MDNKPEESVENVESGGEMAIETEKSNVENDIEPMCVDATDEGDAPPPETTNVENKIGDEGDDEEDVQLENNAVGDKDQEDESEQNDEHPGGNDEVENLPGKSTEEDEEKDFAVDESHPDDDDDNNKNQPDDDDINKNHPEDDDNKEDENREADEPDVDDDEPKDADTSSTHEKEGELNDMEMLENPAEVNVNEDKTTEEHEKEDDFDPMDTTDKIHSMNETQLDSTQNETSEMDTTELDTTEADADADAEPSASESLFDSLRTSEVDGEISETLGEPDENVLDATDENVNDCADESGHDAPDDSVNDVADENVTEAVDDIEEGMGADEEISLLPEREITDADKERAILAAEDDAAATESGSIEVPDTEPVSESQDDQSAVVSAAPDDEDEPEVVAEEQSSALPKDKEIRDAPTPHEVHRCDQCDKDIVCEYLYTEDDVTKYICSLSCIHELRNVNNEKFALNLKKIPIFVILEVRQPCIQCGEIKICNYRSRTKGGYMYLCEASCLSEVIDKGEIYVLKRKRYLIDDSHDNETEHKCLQCSETKICKYSFKQEDDDMYVCHEDCLNLLLTEQPDKIRVKRRSVRVRELPLRTNDAPVDEIPNEIPAASSSESSKIVARTEQEAEDARQDRENSFIRRCIHCMNLVSDPNKQLVWETLDFCNEICLLQYQNIIGANCAYCSGPVSSTSMGKYCVRFGYDIKQFCRSSCLDEYKKGLKVCSYCQEDISTGQGFLASVGDKGQFKDFCTQLCMKKYDEMCNPKKKTSMATCAVCNIEKPGRVQVLLDNKEHKFCSNPCFSAFKFVNNVYPDQCQMCQKYFERKSSDSFTIYQGNQNKLFCSKICMNIHIITNRKIVPCNWCKVKKYNFDMICKTRGSQTLMLCSLNCLTYSEMSMNAISMTSLKCDQCNVMTMPQYLLSMSDASIRNFCTYQCVMAFQGQYSKSPMTLEGVTTTANTTPIPTGLPKRVRKDQLPPQIKTPQIKTTQIKPTATAKLIQPKMPAAKAQTKAQQKAAQAMPVKSTRATMPVITSVQSLAGTGTSTRGKKVVKNLQALPLKDLKVSLERLNTDLTHSVKKSHPATRRSQSSSVATPPPLSPAHSMDNSYDRRPATPIVEYKTQVVVVPPTPKMVTNKTTMCKPIMQTKGVTCRPQMVSVECQTDDDLERKLIIPVPVPMYIPQPMYMYSLPMPIPVPFPIPIPVPVFIPTTRNSAPGIMKEIKKIHEKMPTDPFEAELLMMAEMVAGEKKREESDSGSDAEGEEEFTTETIETNNSFGEDMLSMAFKLATEYEPAVDLESAMPSNTITPGANPPHIGAEEMVDDPALQHHQMILMEHHRQMSTRGRKRGASASNRGSRNNIAATPTKKRRNEINQIVEPPPPEPPREPAEKADAHMCLKFTFGVNAWKQWVMTKNADLEKSSIRRKPFKSDLLMLTADELSYSLCLFVKEVRKPNGSEYAPDTIYYLVLGIQQYLYEHGRIDNIFTDPYYEAFTDCLDEVARKFSVLYNDSQYIVTRVEEEHLWECKQLGAHSPHVLLSTLMFFNTKHFNLTTVEEHMQLSFSHIMKHWKRNPNQAGAIKAAGSRNVLLRFYPPQSALDNNSRKKKVYEQQENEENPLRCPVKLYEFYLSKCPESVKTRNDVFYLQPERSCVPDSPVWYSTQALSRDALSKMLHRVKMVKEINIALLTS